MHHNEKTSWKQGQYLLLLKSLSTAWNSSFTYLSNMFLKQARNNFQILALITQTDQKQNQIQRSTKGAKKKKRPNDPHPLYQYTSLLSSPLHTGQWQTFWLSNDLYLKSWYFKMVPTAEWNDRQMHGTTETNQFLHAQAQASKHFNLF